MEGSIAKGNERFVVAFNRRCVACNLRPASIVQYNKTLKRFCAVYPCDSCTPADIRSFLARLQVAPATKKIHWMTLNVFFNFLYKNGYVQHNPMEAVEKPRVPRKLMRWFSSKEIEQMLNCWDESTFTGCRNKTIMQLFFATGMRRAELAGLTLKDIRWDMDAIFIRGKGGKERTAPLTPELRRILTNYIAMRNKHEKRPCNALFISSNTGEGLTPAGVWSIFSKSPLTGERVSPHTWRRTFCRCMLLNGADLVTIQILCGHSDISTTRKYIAMCTEDIAIANAKYNPLTNNSWKYY